MIDISRVRMESHSCNVLIRIEIIQNGIDKRDADIIVIVIVDDDFGVKSVLAELRAERVLNEVDLLVGAH